MNQTQSYYLAIQTPTDVVAGFAIAGYEGFVITTESAARNCKTLKTTIDGVEYVLQVVCYDEVNGIALLKLDHGSDANFTYHKIKRIVDYPHKSVPEGQPLVTEDHLVCAMSLGGSNASFVAIDVIVNLLDCYLSSQLATAFICSSCHGISHFPFDLTDICCSLCNAHSSVIDYSVNKSKTHIAYKIERMLQKLGYNHKLARRGLHRWFITKGTAQIEISYFESKGYITTEAKLCQLGAESSKNGIYEYLLKQNYYNQSLILSVKDGYVYLSKITQDLHVKEGQENEMLEALFTAADRYDTILIQQFDAVKIGN